VGNLTSVLDLRVGITAPGPIEASHDLSHFSCGKGKLDEWLRERALKNDGPASRTYVVCVGRMVVGFYCLATGGMAHGGLPGKLRRNMPNPTPMLVLGRLAVDRRHQGQGIGSGLMKDAFRRTIEAWRLVGFRALTVHAKDDEALAFYLSYGFIEYPSGARTLFLPVETLLAAL
jgi:GNAT superfamily N-acetyltransferase